MIGIASLAQTLPSAPVLLDNFVTHLAGGMTLKSPRSAAQHCSQLASMWAEISPSRSLADILDRTKVVDTWVPAALKKKQVGTVRSYLSSYNLFLDYLESRSETGVALLEKVRGLHSCLARCFKCQTRYSYYM